MTNPTIKQQKELVKRAQLQTQKLQQLIETMYKVTAVLKEEK